MNPIINAIFFQIGWLLCASSVEHDWQAIACLCCTLILILHLKKCTYKLEEVTLSLLVLTIGIALDSILQYLKVIDFYGWQIDGLSPFWDWMIWLLFATTINHSLAVLKPMGWFVQSCVGLIVSPLSYMTGSKLGAAALSLTYFKIAVIALSWMVLLPFIFFVAKKIHDLSAQKMT